MILHTQEVNWKKQKRDSKSRTAITIIDSKMNNTVLLSLLFFRIVYGFGVVSLPSSIHQLLDAHTHRMVTEKSSSTNTLPVHHTAIRTRNITLAIQFYELFGFEPITKFRAGPARAAWLQQGTTGTTTDDDDDDDDKGRTRLELIEVPSYLLDEPEGMKRRALDLFNDNRLLGLNHFCLDVSETIQQNTNLNDLSDYLEFLNDMSLKKFGKTLRIALQPKQQMIGKGVYELAFLYDADGSLVELLNKQKELEQEITDGWKPLKWDNQDFAEGGGKE